MGTECSTFTLSTRNCTAGRGRTGWNTGVLNGTDEAQEVDEVTKTALQSDILRSGTNVYVSVNYLVSHDDRQQCVQKVELCH